MEMYNVKKNHILYEIYIFNLGYSKTAKKNVNKLCLTF